MLTCITCSKQREDDGEEAPRGTPNTKDAVKSLTMQIKDMALKVSGSSNKSSKPFKTNFKKAPDFSAISEGIPPYQLGQPGSSSSTPVWHYTATGQRTPRPNSRFSGYGDAPGHEVMLEDVDEPKEWTAQVEPGVQITFVSLPHGGNDLKRIRFSRETFNKWQAQRWWGENYDRIMELYNVQKFNQQALNTPGRSEDGRESMYSRLGSAIESPRIMTPRYNNNNHYGVGSSGGQRGEMEAAAAASRTTTSSISNASEVDSEWIEEDEPGVYITIRQLVDGTRELRRVRFSRERFGELHAKQWWETNRDRIQAHYLC